MIINYYTLISYIARNFVNNDNSTGKLPVRLLYDKYLKISINNYSIEKIQNISYKYSIFNNLEISTGIEPDIRLCSKSL